MTLKSKKNNQKIDVQPANISDWPNFTHTSRILTSLQPFFSVTLKVTRSLVMRLVTKPGKAPSGI